MPRAWRSLLVGLAALLGSGTAIGWIYARPEIGLLIAALGALGWQVFKLLAFDRALRTRDFEAFRFGDGIWEQIFARFAFHSERSKRHKLRYRQLLKEIRKSTDAMPDGAVVIDNANEIVMCNKAAKLLAGLRPKKDRGQRVDNILRDPELTVLLRSADSERAIDIASPVRAGDWLNCRVVPYGIDQKMLLLRDVTDRLRLNKMRRDFVANASHELRSPLTVISGYLDSLAEEEGLCEWRMPLTQMQSQARRMNLIIGELLELSRLESAGRAGTARLVDVAALVASTRKAFASRQGAAEICTASDPDLMIRGNGTQIESVITNLVSNAIRHTDADGRISVRWQASGKGAALIVEDSGEGIAAEHIPRITERFFRVDRGRSRDDGGVGLGLAIVKHSLSRHDAVLSIASVVGEGSTFRCEFPRSRVLAGSAGEAERRRAQA